MYPPAVTGEANINGEVCKCVRVEGPVRSASKTAGSVVAASSCQVKILPRPALASAVDGSFSCWQQGRRHNMQTILSLPYM